MGGVKDGEPHTVVLQVSSQSAGAGEGTGIPAAAGGAMMLAGRAVEPGVWAPEYVAEPLALVQTALRGADLLGHGGDTITIEIVGPDGSRTRCRSPRCSSLRVWLPANRLLRVPGPPRATAPAAWCSTRQCGSSAETGRAVTHRAVAAEAGLSLRADLPLRLAGTAARGCPGRTDAAGDGALRDAGCPARRLGRAWVAHAAELLAAAVVGDLTELRTVLITEYEVVLSSARAGTAPEASVLAETYAEFERALLGLLGQAARTSGLSPDPDGLRLCPAVVRGLEMEALARFAGTRHRRRDPPVRQTAHCSTAALDRTRRHPAPDSVVAPGSGTGWPCSAVSTPSRQIHPDSASRVTSTARTVKSGSGLPGCMG
ncbi:MAG: hypothetical protein R2731_19945 [Nocardioides sp.]